MTRARDPGLWCGQLDWLLRCSSSELGQRGTTAAVVSAIERGGAGGSADPHLAMLLRCYPLPLDKGKRAQPNVIAKQRALAARWSQLPPEHQQTLLAHYLATERADGKIRARFGKLAGVVLYRWLVLNEQARQAERQRVEDFAQAALQVAREHAVDLQSKLQLARQSAHHRSADGFRNAARAWYLRPLANKAWSELGRLKRAEHAALDAGSIEADARALASACTRGDPPPLEQDADQACRAAHQAWYDTRAQEALRWAYGEERRG